MNYMRYTGVVIGLTMGLPILLGLLRHLTGINLSTGFVAIAPALAGAMIEGQKFAVQNDRTPTWAETKSFVIVGTLIAAGFLALFTATVVTNVPGYEILLTAPPSIGLIIGMSVFMILIIALCNFLFLRMGAKNQLKAIEAGRSK
ncbi:ABZJ_00895 family protein [Yoonia maritima]|uniref:ABZJ_00895 family protein n=1 Tax=Yoonia maritima TaxID=1435347 RepID=UPI000D1143A1|nr:ABZJ_00895 family protein [Yoonia maritima]